MMNEDETLIILTPGFAASTTDSTCLPMHQDFVRILKELYPRLKIIILSFQYPYKSGAYELFGATVISFNGRNHGGIRKLILRRKISNMLLNIHRKEKIIGLLSFWYGECALVAKRFANKHGISHHCWILGQDARKANRYPVKITPSPEELVALSDFIQDEFELNHGVRPAVVIPPGIDIKRFGNNVAERDIDILGAGSLIPLKQYHLFIEIVSEIKKSIPGIRALLVGEGPERKLLEDLILQRGLSPNIQLAGELSYPEVLNAMKRSRVFLHTSSFEGFGCVCIEALKAGAHVISFSKPMYKEIRHWYIAQSPDEMKLKAIKILQDLATAYEPVSGFNMEDTVRQMMRLFRTT